MPSLLEIVSLGVFVLALIHVFMTSWFEKLAHRFPSHSGVFHLLGEVEVVFGFWAFILFEFHSAMAGSEAAVRHMEGLNFHEPIFVFVVMVVAGCRPILQLATIFVDRVSRLIPLPGRMSFALVTLGLAPLLGSFITEPAAMTVTALLLRDRIILEGTSQRLRYGILGVLFVNISIGGVLTHYAAPPVLMVASAWNWDTQFMLEHFGVRAILGVGMNALLLVLLFRQELSSLPKATTDASNVEASPVPWTLMLAHLGFVALVVLVSHHTVLLVGVFLFFLGFVQAYQRHHSQLLLREALLVGFFLSGLVILGSHQEWWISPLVSSLSHKTLYFGAAGLTAFVDNAALTYLGSLVEATSDSFRYHLVAGAVAGGGLTLIANAPNPAGASILKERFEDGLISPARLFLAALPPTILVLIAFGF